MLRLATVLTLVLAAGSVQAASLCNGSAYERGLCAYRGGNFDDAAKLFRQVIEAAEQSPPTLKSHYFLARSLMKQKKWSEAASELIRIYGLSRAFYDEWNCDFLLGECRRAQGLE
jgi:TolA-binding protein